MSADESKTLEHSTDPSTKDVPAPGESGTGVLAPTTDGGGDCTVAAKPGSVQSSVSRSTEVKALNLVTGQNGIGRNCSDKIVLTKCHG